MMALPPSIPPIIPSHASHSSLSLPPRPFPLSLSPSSPVLILDSNDSDLIIVSDEEDSDATEMEVDGPLLPSSAVPPVDPASPSGESSAGTSEEEKVEEEGEGEGEEAVGGGASTQENRDLQEEDFHDSQHQMQVELQIDSAVGEAPPISTEAHHSPIPASVTGGEKRAYDAVKEGDVGDADGPITKRQRTEASTSSVAGTDGPSNVMERQTESAVALKMDSESRGPTPIPAIPVAPAAAPATAPTPPICGVGVEGVGSQTAVVSVPVEVPQPLSTLAASDDAMTRSPFTSSFPLHPPPVSPPLPLSVLELPLPVSAAAVAISSPQSEIRWNVQISVDSTPSPGSALATAPTSLIGTAAVPTTTSFSFSSQTALSAAPPHPSFSVNPAPLPPPGPPPRSCPSPLVRLLPSATFPLSRKSHTRVTLSCTPFRTLLSLDPTPSPTPVGHPLTKKELNSLCNSQLAVRLEEIEEQVTLLDEAMEKDGRAGVDVVKVYEERQDLLQEEMDAIEEELRERKEKERKRKRTEREKWRQYNGPPPEGEEEEEEEEDSDEDSDEESDEDDSSMEVETGDDVSSHSANPGGAEEVKEPIDAFALGASVPSAATYFDVVAEMSSVYQVDDEEFKRVTAEAARTVRFTSKGLFKIEQIETGDHQHPLQQPRLPLRTDAAETKENRPDPPSVSENIPQHQQAASTLPHSVEENKESPAIAPHGSIAHSNVAVSAVAPLPLPTPPTTAPLPPRLPARSTLSMLSSSPAAVPSPPAPAGSATIISPPRPSPPRSARAGGAAGSGAPITSFFSPARRKIQPSLLSSFNASTSSSSSSSPSPSSPPVPPPLSISHPPIARLRSERVELKSPPTGGDVFFSVIDLTED